MKIIYHCYGGNHSSVTAAAVHLGKLPQNRLPTAGELLSLELFDKQGSRDIGKIIKVGTDGWGNDVFVVGRLSRPQILFNMFRGLGEHFEIAPEDYMLVDVGMLVNNTMRVGGLLSRGFGLINIGRPLVIRGTISDYQKICDLVSKIKNGLQNGHKFATYVHYIFCPEVFH